MNMKYLNKLMDYEDGSLSDNETVELFSELIKSGTIYSLQGSYGRQAERLIIAKYLDERGNILKMPNSNQ